MGWPGSATEERAVGVDGSQGVAGAVGIVLGAVLVLSLTDASAQRCTPRDPAPDWSAPRQWQEALLDSVRRDRPEPTRHARDFHHLAVAVWDSWAAFEPDISGVLIDIDAGPVVSRGGDAADPRRSAQETAIHHAAHHLLSSRLAPTTGASDTLPKLDELLTSRCLPLGATSASEGPAGVGVRVAEAVLAHGRSDGSNETGGYVPPGGYDPVNPPLVVGDDEVRIVDVNRWQPLELDIAFTQNGLPLDGVVQDNIGPHWGRVAGFALPPADADGVPIRIAGPPQHGIGDPAQDAVFRAALVELLEFAVTLDPDDPAVVDASPSAASGGTAATVGAPARAVNPVTGEPYPRNPTRRFDLHRAVAEYWADGPDSETPPGHWVVLANEVSDRLDPELRLGGTGPLVDRFVWDVVLHLTVTAATHDAAIAAWGLKGHYDTNRPVSMIRALASRGQASDPLGPSYDPLGLPLVDGLVEVITPETSAPGAHHAHLAGHEGRIAVRSWLGGTIEPVVDASGAVLRRDVPEVAGIGWTLGSAWFPYQPITFVSPDFSGFVSGHSTFSSAAAVALTDLTGSPYFPEGLHEAVIEPGWFRHEQGPSAPVRLQWVTYADAALQAGWSRRIGGIHVEADDVGGHEVGTMVGRAVWPRVVELLGDSVVGQP